MALFVGIALLLALVLYAGATNHRMDDAAGDSVPERLRHVDPLLMPFLICLCTLVSKSEYTLSNLVCALLEDRVNHLLVTFGEMAVSVACNVAIEYFILQMTGSNASLYWAKNCGVAMSIYLRDAVNNLQEWQKTKRG